MDDNLLRQYDRVVEYVKEQRRSASGFVERYNRRMLFKVTGFVFLYRMARQLQPLSGRMPQGFRDSLLGFATDEDKKIRHVQITLSEYPFDSFAADIAEHFPDLDFGKLKKVHELKKEQLARRFDIWRILGAVLAVSAVLLGQVPQSVVSRVITYADYQLFVFWATVGTLVYLLLLFLPLSSRYDEAKSTHADIGDLLTYITIRQGEKDI